MLNALAVNKQTTKVRDRHYVQTTFLAKPKFLQPILMKIIKKNALYQKAASESICSHLISLQSQAKNHNYFKRYKKHNHQSPHIYQSLHTGPFKSTRRNPILCL